MKLTIELVPGTSWGNNLRSLLEPADWDRLRKAQYAKANYVCEVCGGKGRTYPVECHEIWEYNDRTHVQKLAGLVALCPACHQVKHIGRTISLGQGDLAVAHMSRVNGESRECSWEHVQRALQEHSTRSLHKWTIDLAWLTDQGFWVSEPEICSGGTGEA